MSEQTQQTADALTQAVAVYERAKADSGIGSRHLIDPNNLGNAADALIRLQAQALADAEARATRAESALPLLGRAWSMLQQGLGGHWPRPEAEATVEAIARWYQGA